MHVYMCLSALTHAHTHNSHEGHIPSNFVRKVFEIMATHDYIPAEVDELPLTEGEKLTVVSESEDGWYIARNHQG